MRLPIIKDRLERERLEAAERRKAKQIEIEQEANQLRTFYSVPYHYSDVDDDEFEDESFEAVEDDEIAKDENQTPDMEQELDNEWGREWYFERLPTFYKQQDNRRDRSVVETNHGV